MINGQTHRSLIFNNHVDVPYKTLKNGEELTFGDLTVQEESLRQLAAQKPAEFLFTGHYGFTKDYQKAFKKWQ